MNQEEFRLAADRFLLARDYAESVHREYRDALSNANLAEQQLIDLMLKDLKGDDLTVYKVYRGDLWEAGMLTRHPSNESTNKYVRIKPVDIIEEKVESLPK